MKTLRERNADLELKAKNNQAGTWVEEIEKLYAEIWKL